MEHFNVVTKAAPLLLNGAFMSIQLALLSSMVSLFLGVIFGIMLSRRLRVPFIAPTLDFYVFCVRCIPFYVQLLMVYFVIPHSLGFNISSFSAGVIALGFCSTGYVAEIVRSGLNNLPAGQWDSCTVLGYSQFAAMRYVILPQVFVHTLAPLVSEFIQVIHATSLLSSIGIFELTKAGMNIIAREMNPLLIYGCISVLYLCMNGLISMAAKRLERRFSYGTRS